QLPPPIAKAREPCRSAALRQESFQLSHPLTASAGTPITKLSNSSMSAQSRQHRFAVGRQHFRARRASLRRGSHRLQVPAHGVKERHEIVFHVHARNREITKKPANRRAMSRNQKDRNIRQRFVNRSGRIE